MMVCHAQLASATQWLPDLMLSVSPFLQCACSSVKCGLAFLLQLLLALQARNSHAVIGICREKWGMEPGADNQQTVPLLDVHASQQHRAGALTYIWLFLCRSAHLNDVLVGLLLGLKVMHHLPLAEAHKQPADS